MKVCEEHSHRLKKGMTYSLVRSESCVICKEIERTIKTIIDNAEVLERGRIT